MPRLRLLSIASALTISAVQAQTLEGLYLQLQLAGSSFQHVHYYFWKDGRICRGLATGGIALEPADFGAYQTAVQKQQGECGQYSISGKTMHLHWPAGRSYDASFVNFKDGSFEMNQYTTAHVAFNPGQKIDGTYSATVVGKQMRIQRYVFHTDRTYELSDKPVTSMDGQPKSAVGTYRVYGSTLELTGSSGVTRLTAYPFPDGGIDIEGTVFSK